MFLKNIFQFLKGYVILLLTGHSIERFLNICMRRGLRVWGVEYLADGRVKICLYSEDFKKIRPVAYKTCTRVHIKRKCGLRILIHKYRRRVFFLAGFFIFISLLIVTSRFIWSIDIEGAGEDRREEIAAAVRLAGVRIGAYKGSLPEGNEIKNIILTNTENITWAWVYLKGTKAVVEVREGILPPPVIDKSAPCDVVAVRDGIISKMTVKKGIAFCDENDVVLSGDLLIGGTLTGEDGRYRLEHALGDVWAATYHRRTAQIKLYRDVRTKTGRKKSYTDLVIFSKNIPLYRQVDVPFEEYSITEKRRELKWGKEGYIGIEAVTNVYEEETVERVPLSMEEALEGAKYELEKEIAGNLLPGSELTDEEMVYTQIDDETVEITLTMQFVEKIGGEAPIEYTPEEVPAEEKQE
jgi:similar to stage IV sporulation protein